jgi:SAM-dependent methyltransferase
VSFKTGTDAYARHVGRYTDALAAAHADRAAAQAGDRALDVGCGSGAVLAALASRLGAEQVAGVDPSPPFVALARERVPAADVRLASAEALPFPDRSFDVVLSQLVLNFMDDARAGVREMRRVARRTVASCVWDYTAGMTMLRAFWDAAREVDADAPDEGRTMRWCSPPELAELWTDAGLSAIEVGEIVVSARYDDFEDYWSPFPSGIAPSGAFCASLSPGGQAALRDACFRRLGRPEGPFELDARAWFVSGSR